MNYTDAIPHGAMFQRDTSGGQRRPAHEEIRNLAYEFYERRGKFVLGFHLYWFGDEDEKTTRTAAPNGNNEKTDGE